MTKREYPITMLVLSKQVLDCYKDCTSKNCYGMFIPDNSVLTILSEEPVKGFAGRLTYKTEVGGKLVYTDEVFKFVKDYILI